MRKLSFAVALFCSLAVAQVLYADETREVTITITGMT